jgi:hypothetical protein
MHPSLTHHHLFATNRSPFAIHDLRVTPLTVTNRGESFTIYDSRFHDSRPSNAMHRIKQVFALGVNMHSQLFTLTAQSVL